MRELRKCFFEKMLSDLKLILFLRQYVLRAIMRETAIDSEPRHALVFRHFVAGLEAGIIHSMEKFELLFL